MKIIVRLWPWFAALLTGWLLTLCFPPWDQEWLCWVALIPLVSAVWFSGGGGKRPWLRNAALGYCAGLVFFWTVFSWLITVTGGGWFILAFYLALYFAFWAWFVGAVAGASPDMLRSRHNLWLAFACAAAWTAQEWARGVVFSGFGWNNLGVALYRNLALIQIADITGVWGLTFLAAFCNIIAVVTIRRFILEIRIAKLRPHWDFSTAMLLVVLVFLYGIHSLQNKTTGLPLRVAAIQANIPETEKFDDQFEQTIFDRYTALTKFALAGKPRLLIWPESATPRGMFSDQVNFDFVNGIAALGDFNFLLGSVDYESDADYNDAFLLTNHARDVQKYRKIHLVPFGEYIPLRHSFPLFAMIAGTQVPGDFRPGHNYAVLQTANPAVKLAALICFEDTIGDLTRRFVLKGAQLLVNVTNDGWFLKSAGSDQHLANAVLRTVETRRPLVRCANTGVTCFIDTLGRTTQSLRTPNGGHFIEGILAGVVQVPQDGHLTFYVRHGDLVAYGSLAFVLLFIGTRIWRRNLRGQPKPLTPVSDA